MRSKRLIYEEVREVYALYRERTNENRALAHGNFNGYCMTYILAVLSPRVRYIASSNFLVAQFSLIRLTVCYSWIGSRMPYKVFCLWKPF